MSSKVLHLDVETFVGSVDLRDVGAYRYAFSEDCEILVAAFAFGDEDPQAWTCLMEDWECDHLQPYFEALRDPTVLVTAHHAMFESAILQALSMKTWGIPAPALERFRCTMSLARRAALPGKLEKLAEVLNLGNQKDKRGKALLKKFSMLQPAKRPSKKHPNGMPPHRIRPQDDPAAFAELLQYCLQDVRAEQEVARKLAYFDDPINNANYTLDQKINARGVPVNLAALHHAQKLIDEETEIVSAKFRELTGFEVTQNAVFLEWINSFDHMAGTELPNLQAETIDTYLEQWEGQMNVSVVTRALRLKQSIAYASIKKVKTMLECAGPHDNRIRGMLNHHGATTGRWTASLVQFQNMKRPTIKHSEDAYREICEGVSREMLECCYGPVLEVISSCIRHFVHDVKEKKPRMIVWFSCGAASAVAAKLAVTNHAKDYEVIVVCCDTRPSEHEDNYRFSAEVENWIGQPIKYISNSEFKTVDDVFEKHRYMAGPKGARCTVELKKKPRFQFANAEDIHVFGFTADEQKRIREFCERNPDMHLKWLLAEAQIGKQRCYQIIKDAGIELPIVYKLGFDNNNCPGCVKSTSPWYWDMTRTHFPEVFQRRCEQSRKLGVRLVELKGERIFLDELPPGPFKKIKKKESMSCGPECGIAQPI